MNIIITNTSEAITEASNLNSVVNSYASIIKTLNYTKTTLNQVWTSGAEIESINNGIDSCVKEYEDKIMLALSKLSTGVIAYCVATEELAQSGQWVNSDGTIMSPAEATEAYYTNMDQMAENLLEKNEDGSLTTLNGSLATYLEEKLDLKSMGYNSGQEYIDSVVSKAVASANTNREKSVAAVTAITNLAAENGVKLEYEYAGGHWRNGSEKVVVVKNSDLSTGVDCSGFVSWAVQKGSAPPESFPSCGTGELLGRGVKTSNVSAQAGDIIVRHTSSSSNSDGYGHTGFILKNDVDSSTMLIAEAHSSGEGVIVKEYSYNDLAYQGYSIRDMTSYYADSSTSASM